MLLPSKHIKFSESILGLSGLLIEIINEPMSLENLRIKFFEKYKDKETYHSFHTLDNIILSLTFLYSINKLDLNSKGELFLCD